MTQTCPSCAQPASGRFCSHCGASLGGPVTCAACGNQLPEGGRFCNQCGSPAGAALPPASAHNQQEEPTRRDGSNLAWLIAGTALIALMVVLLLPRLRDDAGDSGAAPVASGPPITGTTGDPRAVDLSSMTPREAADRLFNRVMQSVSAGDSAQARQFLPMALGAYDRVPDLDLDGQYHVAVLHLVGGDAPAARKQANTILAQAPNHLFGLITAAQAERMLGNQAAARDLYRRFLEAYDEELATERGEYREHEPVLPAMREEAERMVGGA